MQREDILQVIRKIPAALILIPFVFWISGCELAQQGQLPEPIFEVSFLNVGQGDAALIQSPGKEFALIDAGPDSDILKNHLLNHITL